MSARMSENVQRAENIRRGQSVPPEEILSLAKQLKKERAFGAARKILRLARLNQEVRNDAGQRLTFAQQHALCTYKDPDLPTWDRLEQGLNILREVEDLRTTRDQETLGLAGAIYKRKWELDGQKQHLERSLAFYQRGYQQGPATDYGYTGINAAYVLDMLASLETREAEKAGMASATAQPRADEANRIREDLNGVLPPLTEQAETAWLSQEWWFLVTMAETLFGLERYEEALSWLTKAAALPEVPVWEYESTTSQLATLARLHAERKGEATPLEQTKAWQVLTQFLGHHEAGVRTAFAGKVGLALSGGGFRASLYHIGVLAKLAELDMLRHVEVLSCVSGGSILGAHYYLEVRNLLQQKADEEITREDYIEIVKRLQNDFLAGVQRNIRTRVAASFVTNARMIFQENYSRTQYVGELYEKEIYSRIKDGEGDRPRWLNDLYVQPKGEVENFKPKYDNWRRRAKVPTLILNATALNTGHTWQFTASWMGESPADINPEVDGNERLRRMYFSQAPLPYQRFRLGHAVAASSCVPGLFEPIVLQDLYPDRIVRLVDGGVHDNQGVGSLLEQDCRVMLVSDAAGQMTSEMNPSSSMLGVPLRSNGILMSRVRETEYADLLARRRSSVLRGLMFVHLKKDLKVAPVDWIQCEDPDEKAESMRAHPLTSYGILKDIQQLLAAIRTDLDSFSDMEAYALMTSGYRMTEYEFGLQRIKDLPQLEVAPEPWDFLVVEKPMKQKSGCEAEHENLKKLLGVGGSLAFKIWKLSQSLKYIAMLLGLGVIVFLSWWCWTHRGEQLPFLSQLTYRWLIGVVGLSVLGALVGKKIMRIVRFREMLPRMAMGAGMAGAGFLLARLHLHIFDKWFLARGKVSTKEPPHAGESA